MKRAFLLIAALAVALLPAQVKGQLNGFIQEQEYLDWLGGSGVGSVGLSSSVQVGPYRGELDPYNARAVTSNAFALYCVDYLHYARTRDPYQVNVYGLGGDVGDLSTTRFGDQSTYLRAAYLTSLFEDYESSPEKSEIWSGLHAAIWSVTSGVDVASSPEAQGIADAFLALAVPAEFTGDGWYVLSASELEAAGYSNPDYDGTGQEFLMRRVPEPGTILLMLTGFVMLVGVSRKRILAFEGL